MSQNVDNDSQQEQQLQSHEYKVFIENYSKLKSILNIHLERLKDRFVTECIIDLEDKDTIGVDTLLNNIGVHLKNDINSTFHKMVKVMQESGNLAVEELGRLIQDQLGMLSIAKTSTVDFTIIDDVEDMFVALVSALRSMLSEDQFTKLRRGYNTNKVIRRLPSDLVDEIRNTKTLDDLFDVIVKSPYCNWMNIRLLEQMAAASLQPNVHQLIDQYKNAVYSKRLQDVFQQMPEFEVPEDYYSKVKQRWNKEFQEVTLKDVVDHWQKLEKIFGVEEPTLLLERIIKSSVLFHWLIPSELVCHARYLAFENWYELNDILYLDICDHVIKDSQYEFSITSSNAATPYEVIDHFTDFLLVSLKHEMLLPLMYSHGLLADHDLELITAAPTGYHRNRLILGCVRHMDITGLCIFNEVLQETHPHIKIPLIDALHSAGFTSLRSFKLPLTGLPKIPHPFGILTSMQEKEDSDLAPRSRKRPLSSQQDSSASKYFKPSVVNREFLQLTDQLNELMQFCDPEMIMEHCSTLMASDVHSIPVFPTEYVKKLQSYNHTPSLLRILGSFWTWSDDSVLRVLLKSNSEAVSLLDKFDAQTDLSQQLASYPLPSPSSCMAPSDNSTHTVLAVKCAQQYYQCLLKHVLEARLLMTEKFEITPHSLQLLATKNSSTVLYWLIPKSVVTLISAKVLEYSSVLYAAGILEVSIFPGTRMTTQAVSLSGPLVFLSPTTLPGNKVPTKLSSSAITELMSLPEELPEVVHDLLLEMEEKDALLQQYDRDRQRLQAQIHEQRDYTESKEELRGATVYDAEESQSIKEKSSDHFGFTEKAQLEELDQVGVFTEQSNVLTQLEGDIEELEEQVRKKGMYPEVVPPELEGSVKLPSYASASKHLDALIYHDVIIHKELGSGSYGTEYQVSSVGELMSGKILHDKLLPTGEKLHKMIEQFKSDCFLAVTMDHPNIIKYFGMCFIAPHKFPMLLQEFAAENLAFFLERTKNTLTFAQKLRLSVEMAGGLEFLHARLIVHKNLDASNVLIDKDGHAKIGDFIAPQLDDIQVSLQNNSVYTAPEVVGHKYFSCESDVFSLGVLNLYLFTEVTLTAGKLQETVQDVKYRPLKQLICSCITDNVMDRPNASQVCQQIGEIQRSPTAVAYEALTSQNAIDFTEAMISGRYTIRWSQCKPLDLPTWWAYAVTIGEKIYVCGGNSAATQSEDVFVYYVLEDTWRTLPQPGAYYAVPVNIGGKLTLVGGRDTTVYRFSAKLFTFDDATQSWIKEFPDLLTARSRPGVVVCSHYLIVAGGKLKSKGQLSNEIEFLDLEESPLCWKKSGVKLPTHMWDLTVFSSENHFWIVGYGDNRRRNFVHKIAINDIVSSVPSAKKKYDWMALEETKYWKCTILSNNGSLPILLGGENKENAPSDAICFYDFDTGAWMESQVAFLSMPRAFPAVSLIGNNAVITIGGCSDSKKGKSEDYSVKSAEIGILEIKH